jgi:hypothetical protein
MGDIGVYIALLAVCVVAGVLLRYGIPYMKALIANEDFAYICEWTEHLVRTAEQTMEDVADGERKKEWVVGRLQELNIVVDDSVDALIESAVFALKDLKKQS